MLVILIFMYRNIKTFLSALVFLMSWSVYYIKLFMQGTAVRVEFGDATTAADPSSAHAMSRSFPHTFGQPLVHFLRATAKVPDAQIITEHPAIRSALYEYLKRLFNN